MEEQVYQPTTLETGMVVQHDTRLNSSETASLWKTIMNYSMILCVLKYFDKNVDDLDIKSLNVYYMGSLEKRISIAKGFLMKDKLPVPIGFGDEDIDLEAPRLFSDLFILYYYDSWIRFGIARNGVELSMVIRPDIRNYFTEIMNAATDIWDKTADLLLAKGLVIRPPYVTLEDNVDYVKKQTFLQGFLGKKRPILSVEVQQLFYNMMSNTIGKALLTGFRQVARSEQVRSYFKRGLDMTEKNIDVLSSLLRKEDVPSSMPWDTFVTDSTTSPFSEKLMMYKILMSSTFGITSYASGMSSSLRHDISAVFMRMIAESMSYAEDGTNIMIDNGWFEEPPRVVNRKELINEPKH